MTAIARSAHVQLEVWSDVVCPWCYLGRRNLDRALETLPFRDEIDVTFRAFELNPGAAAGTTTPAVEMLSAKYGMTAEQARRTQAQMEQRAADVGLTLRMDELRSGNTRAAHRLACLAKAEGIQAGVVEALHRAYFTEQRDIFTPDSLVEIATDAGLGRDEAAAVLAGAAYEEDVIADEQLAGSLGISAVPFFAIDRRYGVAGAQPPEILAESLRRAYAEAGQ